MSTPAEKNNLQPRHQMGVIASNLNLEKMGQHEGFAVILKPLTYDLPESPIIDDMNTIWDLKKFSEMRRPLNVKELSFKDIFSKATSPSVTDMPIKFPGTGYRIPNELRQYKEALQACIDFEHASNPKARENYYAYLTIDQSYVKRGSSQRGLGLHSDSIQGPRIQPKVEIEHTYLCVDRDPTVFCVQPFDMGKYDTRQHWLNAIFEQQAKKQNYTSHNPYTVNLFDAYSVHSAVPAAESATRTLFRLIYSVRQFDRLGNTHNNLFDYNWKMQRRPLPANLAALKK